MPTGTATIRKAVKRSGLSQARFAVAHADLLGGRSIRTLKRWLAGKTPVPEYVRDRLKAYLTSTTE